MKLIDTSVINGLCFVFIQRFLTLGTVLAFSSEISHLLDVLIRPCWLPSYQGEEGDVLDHDCFFFNGGWKNLNKVARQQVHCILFHWLSSVNWDVDIHLEPSKHAWLDSSELPLKVWKILLKMHCSPAMNATAKFSPVQQQWWVT